MKSILAWHFTGNTLRDGSPIPAIGETLRHDGPMEMCRSGLHASIKLRDALEYAPGNMLHRVRCGGEIIRGDDKLICRERTILWSLNAECVLHAYARACALSVVHLWNAPEVVVKYLKTGDVKIRDAARDAAWDAAWSAAWSAARAAARDAAWDAARAAARDAARAAARDAAWDAARAAQNKMLTRMVMAARRKEKP
jgi:hypothetical protein